VRRNRANRPQPRIQVGRRQPRGELPRSCRTSRPDGRTASP